MKYWMDWPTRLETILSNFIHSLEPSATVIMHTPNRWSTPIKMPKFNYLWLHELMPCLGARTQNLRKKMLEASHARSIYGVFLICQHCTSKGLINKSVSLLSPSIRNILHGVDSREVTTIFITLTRPQIIFLTIETPNLIFSETTLETTYWNLIWSKLVT